MAKCIGCGAENQAGEKFCAECGMKLPVDSTEQAEKHSVVNDQSVAAMGAEQFEAYRAEFEKVAKDGSVNLLARRKLKSVQKLLNLSDDQAKAFEERIQAEWKQRQAEIAARKAEEERIRQEELDKKHREEEEREKQRQAEAAARKAEEERIRQEELDKKRREEAARKAEEDRIRQEERERKRREKEEAEKVRQAEEARKKEEERKKEEQELLAWYERRCANDGKWQTPNWALVMLSPIALLVGILFLCFGWTVLGLIGMGAAGVVMLAAFDGKCPSWFDNACAGYLILLAFVGGTTLFCGGRWFWGLIFLIAGCVSAYALFDSHANEQKKIERAKVLKEKQQNGK